MCDQLIEAPEIAVYLPRDMETPSSTRHEERTLEYSGSGLLMQQATTLRSHRIKHLDQLFVYNGRALTRQDVSIVAMDRMECPVSYARLEQGGQLKGDQSHDCSQDV